MSPYELLLWLRSHIKFTKISLWLYGLYLSEFELLNCRRELYMVAHVLQECGRIFYVKIISMRIVSGPET